MEPQLASQFIAVIESLTRKDDVRTILKQIDGRSPDDASVADVVKLFKEALRTPARQGVSLDITEVAVLTHALANQKLSVFQILDPALCEIWDDGRITMDVGSMRGIAAQPHKETKQSKIAH